MYTLYTHICTITSKHIFWDIFLDIVSWKYKVIASTMAINPSTKYTQTHWVFNEAVFNLSHGVYQPNNAKLGSCSLLRISRKTATINKVKCLPWFILKWNKHGGTKPLTMSGSYFLCTSAHPETQRDDMWYNMCIYIYIKIGTYVHIRGTHPKKMSICSNMIIYTYIYIILYILWYIYFIYIIYATTINNIFSCGIPHPLSAFVQVASRVWPGERWPWDSTAFRSWDCEISGW